MKKVAEYPFHFQFRYNGIYRLSAESIELSDLFGLVRKKTAVFPDRELVVYPNSNLLIPYQDACQNADEQEEEEVPQKGDDVSEIFQIRAYQPGDRLQRIHWKLTAKTGELMVKEYAKAHEDKLKVYVELAWNGLKQYDSIFDLTFSFCNTLVMNHVPFAICFSSWNSKDAHMQEVATKEEILQLITIMYDVFLTQKDDQKNDQKNDHKSIMGARFNKLPDEASYFLISTRNMRSGSAEIICTAAEQTQLYVIHGEST